MTCTRRGVAAAAAMSCVLASLANAGLVDPALDEAMRAVEPGATVSALVYMTDQVDLVGLQEEFDAARTSRRDRHEIVVSSLQKVAAFGQADFLDHVVAETAAGNVKSHKSFWISNIVQVEATPAAIRAMAERADVDRIYLDYPIETITPVSDGPAEGGPVTGAIEPGVVAVRAPEAWALGYDGSGVLVSHMDTGVDGNHPSLASRWKGVDPAYAGNPQWAWFDPWLGDNSFPYEDAFNTHGTHVMGSICGGAPGDQIGVAPGSQWIAAGAIDRSGAGIDGTVTNAIEGFQWIADPDGDFTTVWDVPRTNSNSWGLLTVHGYPDCDETFWGFVDAVEAAGCAVFFAAGNEGTSGLRRPADRGTTEYSSLAVAAVNANDPSWPIASFSSRGPTSCGPGGTTAIKPDISAPGDDVRSAAPGGGYSIKSGTSMAAPHVNGVAALVLQANPELTVNELKQILYETATDLGAAGEDNTFGYGMIDAYEAVQRALISVQLTFSFPDGHPEFINPSGNTVIRVAVAGQAGTPAPGSGVLHFRYDTGPYTTVSMNEVAPNLYEARFPGFPCGAAVEYFFSVETTLGETAYAPFDAPTTVFSADAYSGIAVAYEDNFEADSGWTVSSENLTDGEWQRGVPAGLGDRGDPLVDGDGSGSCWLTDNVAGNSDVDGGPTRVTSPIFDISSLDTPNLSYYRWFTNDDNDADNLLIEISNNGGASWVTLENVVGNTNGWIQSTFLVSDFVAPSSQMRLRFSAADNPNDSVTEAGIDGIRVTELVCDTEPCEGDVDGSGVVDFDDLLGVLAAWGCPGCPNEDLDDSGTVDFGDIVLLLASWGPC